MMTLQEMKKAVDTLSTEERAELLDYIAQQELRHEIDAMLADEPTETPPSGTMDIARLQQATDGMWSDLDDNEINAIVTAMNEKNIKPDQHDA